MSFQPYELGPPALTGDLSESETEVLELSAEFVFAVLVSRMLGFFATSPALGLLLIQLPQPELLSSWASAVLGLCLTGA